MPQTLVQLESTVKRMRASGDQVLAQDFLHLSTDVLIPITDRFRIPYCGYYVKKDTESLTNPDPNALLTDKPLAVLNSGQKLDRFSPPGSLLWLTRACELALDILKRLRDDKKSTMRDIVWQAYCSSLRQFHPWYSRWLFSLAVKRVPKDRQPILESLGFPDETEMTKFLVECGPVIAAMQRWLAEHGINEKKHTGLRARSG